MSGISPYTFWEYRYELQIPTENARLFKGEYASVLVKPAHFGPLDRIRDVFWHSNTGHPIFLAGIQTEHRDIYGAWTIKLHNPFGDDVYVEVFGIEEHDAGDVMVDVIGDPTPLEKELHRITPHFNGSKSPYWLLNPVQVPASQNPVKLSKFQTSNILTLIPSGFNKRIRDFFWIVDKSDSLVLLGMKKRDLVTGQWQIMLHNNSNQDVSIELFILEEELVGNIDVTN